MCFFFNFNIIGLYAWVIKPSGWVSRKYNLMSRFSRVQVEQHFPVINQSSFSMEVFPLLSLLLTTERSDVLHGHKKRKDSLETRAVLLIFLLEPEISRVAVQSIHQNSATDQNRCRSKRASQMLLVCCNLLNSQNIPINQ